MMKVVIPAPYQVRGRLIKSGMTKCVNFFLRQYTSSCQRNWRPFISLLCTNEFWRSEIERVFLILEEPDVLSRETRESPVSELQIHFPISLIFCASLLKLNKRCSQWKKGLKKQRRRNLKRPLLICMIAAGMNLPAMIFAAVGFAAALRYWRPNVFRCVKKKFRFSTSLSCRDRTSSF